MMAFNNLLFTFDRSLNRQPADLKKNRSYILGAWLLLVFFVGGQVILYAHQHRVNQFSGHIPVKHASSQQTVTEKCALCDALHLNTMVAGEHAVVVHLLVASHYDYQVVTYSFTSLSLILSTGRAPPVS
jgi:hypothetical protein